MTFEEFCHHFRHGAWREENSYRRKCERAIALHSIDNGAELEPLLHHWKMAVEYSRMNRNDRESFRQQKSNVRQTVKFWQLLHADEQNQFRTGDLLPYRVVELIRGRRASQGLPG